MAQRSSQPNRRKRWQRRGLSRRARIWLLIAAAVVLLAGVLGLAISRQWITLPSWEDIFSPDPGQTEPTGPAQPDTVITFVAGGDLIATDSVVSAGLTGGSYDYSDVFLDVAPVLAGADLSVLNFEGNLAGEPYGSTHFSAPQALMESLSSVGVDLIQTANSKAVENGLLGLQATIDGIRAAGMQNLGTYKSPEDFRKSGGYLIREVDGIRVALVAFTKGLDGRGLPSGSEDCVNLLYTDYSSTYQSVDTEGITAVMNKVSRENPDIVIAMLHWGSELNNQISKTQTKIVKLLGSLGVDAIVGTHSHYVQTMGFDKDTGMFVAYSLGDFLGDGKDAGTDYSVLLQLEITKNGKSGKTAITGFDCVPIYRQKTEEGIRLLRIRQALAAYENRYIDAVSQEDYEAMQSALNKIESRIEK